MLWLTVVITLAAAAAPSPLTPNIPASLQAEHHELHHRLEALVSDPGEVGKAARHLEAVLAPHFHREEEIALPPLGLLRPLAEGRSAPEMKPAIAMAESLKAELPRMLQEHGEVKKALEALAAAGRSSGRPDVASYVEALERHAATEEEILYPAAILAGERVKQGLAP
jgi:hypothetical protein